MSYLATWTLRLAGIASNLPETFRQTHGEALIGRQNADGGFAGRKGASDPYYTSFALRGLGLLGALDENVGQRVAAFLDAQESQWFGTVDFFSWIFSAALIEAALGSDALQTSRTRRARLVEQRLDTLRRRDGGYAKTPDSPHASTYITFLALATRQLVGLVGLAEPELTVALLRSRAREDGGFVELGPLKHGGTNPTAAAIGAMQILGRLDPDIGSGATRFLLSMQTPDGGWRANARLPIADLLSTFTALLTLTDLNALDQVDRGSTSQFVRSLERPGGGFRAAIWDDTVDVEYTFYGLATTALTFSEGTGP